MVRLFQMFLKDVLCSLRLHYFHKITVISLLQSSVSHDPSDIILIFRFSAQEGFLIIITVENSCAAQYFCGNSDKNIQESLWNRKFKIQNSIYY